MAQLAIKGHATRGSEVIEILGILGGSNAFGHIGNNPRAIYYIDKNYKNFITCSGIKKVCDCIIFTLEEFLEKYPYKVGDKVIYEDKRREITKMVWEEQTNTVAYKLDDKLYCNVINKLQPYKEETMETITIDDFKANTKEWLIDKLHGMIISDAIKTIGNIHDELCKPKYPKTYVECAKILDCFGAAHIDGYKCELLEKFQELLICRDAYWKIAGEQMGLGKPWQPDWTNNNEVKFIIGVSENEIIKCCNEIAQYILAFPTEEMRDTFYENFKELIEACKELL